jgi:hypothetical protein
VRGLNQGLAPDRRGGAHSGYPVDWDVKARTGSWLTDKGVTDRGGQTSRAATTDAT